MANTIKLSELNEMMAGYAKEFFDAELREQCLFSMNAANDRTALAMYIDESDDGDFTECAVGWLSMRGNEYECELTDDGYTELEVFNVAED